jgi:exosortase
MNGQRWALLFGFVLLGAGIWMRVPLGESAEDLLPALAAFPLYFWFTRPWQWKAGGPAWDKRPLLVGAGVLVVGAALDHTLILALGWVALWRGWMGSDTEAETATTKFRPLVLLVFGFPWLGIEGQAIGWWFRYSGAWAAGGIFEVVGLSVTREGTFLNVQGLPLAVDAACSGLHALQAMLVAGTVMALSVLPGGRFWLGLALLPLLAWLANLLRIVTLGVTGLSFGSDAAMGWFHDWGGWGVLMVMFILCSGVFNLMGRRPTTGVIA